MARKFDTPLITSDASIDRVLAAALPVLFIFLDDSPAPPLDQAMKQLARDYAGKLLVVQAPVKDSLAAARRYGLNQFPALVTVREGQVQSQADGIAGADLNRHAVFLLGQGPRPQPKPQTIFNGHNGAGPSQNSPADSRPMAANDVTFDEIVLHSPKPVLVDFWAPWCGPCRMVEPILETLAQNLAGRLRVVKVNVDENPVTARRYSIQSIPTMMIVKHGQITDRWTGALPEGSLRSRIMPFLGG